MDKPKHKYFPFRITNVIDSTSLFAGYAIMAILIANSLSKDFKNIYLMLMAVGFVILGIACFLLANINLSIDMASVVIPNILSGVAMGLIFVPLTTLSFGTLKQQEFGTAAGLFNLMRNIGGSVGISLVNTLLHRFSQTHQNYLVDKLNPYNPVFQQKVGQLTTNFSHYTDPAHATYLAEAVIHRNLIIQSTLSAFVDNLRLFGFLCFIVVPLAFLFNKVSKKKA